MSRAERRTNSPRPDVARARGLALACLAAVAATGASSACTRTHYAQVGDVVQGRGFDPFRSEPDAIRGARAAVTYAGGWEGWDQVRFVRFREVTELAGAEPVVATHAWDRSTGTYRFAGARVSDGQEISVVIDIATLAGASFVAGARVVDPALDEALRNEALGRWRQVAGALFVPFRLNDPGARLRRTESRRGVEVIEATFEPLAPLGGVAPPREVWWLHLDEKTGQVLQTDVKREGEEAATAWAWDGWVQAGPVALSLVRTDEQGRVRVRYEDVEIRGDVPADAFVMP